MSNPTHETSNPPAFFNDVCGNVRADCVAGCCNIVLFFDTDRGDGPHAANQFAAGDVHCVMDAPGIEKQAVDGFLTGKTHVRAIGNLRDFSYTFGRLGKGILIFKVLSCLDALPYG